MEEEIVVEKVNPRISQKKMKLAVEVVKRAKYRKLKKRHDAEIESDEEKSNGNLCNINFNSLQVQTLRRYKKVYRLKSAGINKNQLVEACTSHFLSIPVQKEKEIIAYFIYNIKHSHDTQDNNEDDE